MTEDRMINETAATVPSGPVVWTLAQRELVRFFRQRNRVVGAFLQPIMFWGLFSLGLRGSGLGPEFFFPGTLAMILLFHRHFLPPSQLSKIAKKVFLQSVLVAPAPRWAMVLGKILGGSLIAMLQALVFLGLGWLTLKLTSSATDILLAILLMMVIAVALTSLGFFIAWRMESTQGFSCDHERFFFFLCGFYPVRFSPDESGSWLTLLSRFNPLTYGVAGLRQHLRF